MNMMKTTIITGAVSLLIPSFIFGWVLPIYNKTTLFARVSVEYPGCKTDLVDIPAGGQSNVDAKGCLVTTIRVNLFENAAAANEAFMAFLNPPDRQNKQMRGFGGMDDENPFVFPGQKQQPKKAPEPTKPPPKPINITWSVSGHRDFSIAIERLPNGTFSLQAKYGAQLWTQVGTAIEQGVKTAVAETKKGFETAGKEIKKGVEIAAAETKKGFEIAGQEIKKGVEIAAAETKKAFETAGKEIKKGFEDFGTIIEKQVLDPIVAAGDDVLKRLKDCAETVALGSEWAAKKAAYEGALAGLAATQEINKSDPFVFAIQATKVAALAGLDAGKLGAQALSAILEGLGTIIGGGFNITEVSFDAQAQDLAQGKLPMFNIKGVFLGKSCDLKFQFDVTKPDKSMEAVVKELIKVIPGV